MTSHPKKILITGSTGNIGRIVAKSLARDGAEIALHYHSSKPKALELVAEITKAGARAFPIEADLINYADTTRLIEEASRQLGHIDVLIHTASIFLRTPLGTVTEGQWDKILSLDLKSVFFLAQAAGISMQRNPNGGKMIFFSDVAASRPYAGYLPYCVAKAGVDALVMGLAKTLAPKVLVNAIAPYVVTRPMGLTDKGLSDLLSKIPSHKASSPEEIAVIVKMLIDSGESLTGQIIAVDGGRLLR